MLRDDRKFSNTKSNFNRSTLKRHISRVAWKW